MSKETIKREADLWDRLNSRHIKEKTKPTATELTRRSKEYWENLDTTGIDKKFAETLNPLIERVSEMISENLKRGKLPILQTCMANELIENMNKAITEDTKRKKIDAYSKEYLIELLNDCYGELNLDYCVVEKHIELRDRIKQLQEVVKDEQVST